MPSHSLPQILAIPLDDRPISAHQLFELSQVCAAPSLKMPPKELIATHTPEFKFESLWSWLEDNIQNVDAAIISLDQFLYGGLVRSRKNLVSIEQAIDRLNRLRVLQEKNSHCRFYFTSVLLRLTVTLEASTSEEIWRNVFRYSVLAANENLSAEQTKELSEIKNSIPPAILEEYLAVRKRNHHLNKEALKLLNGRSSLLFGQEDCGPQGLHQKEKSVLRTEIQKNKFQDRVVLCTGADELTSMMLLSCWMELCNVKSQTVPCYINFSSDLNRVSLFEDITVNENLQAHLRLTPFYPVYENSPATSVALHILMFEEQGQKDLFFAQQNNLDQLELVSEKKIEEWKQSFKNYEVNGFLDLVYGNGAYPLLEKSLPLKEILQTFQMYSAWNTTGNAMGTLISHMGLVWVARQNGFLNARASEQYLKLRILDDMIYQTYVRKDLIRECLKKRLNSWALGDHWREISDFSNDLMQKQARHFKLLESFKTELSWPRIFEADTQFLEG